MRVAVHIMTPLQAAAHERLMRSLPVHSIGDEPEMWGGCNRDLSHEERSILAQIEAADRKQRETE